MSGKALAAGGILSGKALAAGGILSGKALAAGGNLKHPSHCSAKREPLPANISQRENLLVLQSQ
jgi:hypothetical protein